MFRKRFTPFCMRVQTASPLLTAGFIVVSAGCEEHVKVTNQESGMSAASTPVADEPATSSGSGEAIRFSSPMFDYPNEDKP
ncbi:MAG TPA: hypothetical protein PLY87_18245 [Planctomycetaceae bacterium]|nr:hypothetical protein [Planctomycetaceae bacterium]